MQHILLSHGVRCILFPDNILVGSSKECQECQLRSLNSIDKIRHREEIKSGSQPNVLLFGPHLMHGDGPHQVGRCRTSVNNCLCSGDPSPHPLVDMPSILGVRPFGFICGISRLLSAAFEISANAGRIVLFSEECLCNPH